MDADTSSDDSNQTLSQIAQKHGRSIVDMLVDIQESVVPQSKSISFLERLECLQPIEYPYDNPPRDSKTGEIIPPRSTDDPAIEYKFMRRCHVNVFDLPDYRHNYVALSYTWQPQDGDDNASGRYWIENKQQTGFDISPVRNIVLDRITNYMSAKEYGSLWIDQHCTTQTTTCTSGSCSHKDCNEKRDAVHAMDLVYSASSAPTALLSHCIESKDDLLLLADLFNADSKLMESDPSTDGEPNNRVPTRARAAINLVYEIISDPWWARAWPFQENILARSKMQLLLRHAPELEDIKATTRMTRFKWPDFDTVPGELCISSSTFSLRATWLWVAVKRRLLMLENNGGMVSEGDKRCVNMLFEIDRAIRGTRRRQMTMDHSCVVASFVQIVERKAIANYWDRLAIIGNCSRFSTRLEPLELQSQGHSISISTLALFLLNGEVLDNGKERDSQKMLNLQVSLYLEAQLLDNMSDTEAFTGNCRLPDVVLTIKGVRTRGHLWQLGEVIPLSKAEDSPASNTRKNLFVTQVQLQKLIRTFEDLGYTPLAADFKAFLEQPTSRSLFFPDQLAQGDGCITLVAITRGWPIRLGRIWDPNVPDDKSMYHGLFVFAPHGTEDIKTTAPSLVFTSTVKQNRSPRRHDNSDTWGDGFGLIRRRSYQYAILQVEVIQSESQVKSEPVIALRTQRWVNGICFPEDTPPREVVFPWPDELLKVVPDHDGQEVGQS